ncbi:hypothetical protein [Paenibacillus roseipurpureus]|uniref:Uncharacterized protein n=1 Tax=Paenibacillus roseopurpureus TaxID=2918901 RepID=A0AA96RLU2_9BACL|nr:hypothetical protein [Paenibacillus sp. MBLB1832]WNR45771.1 hypothetical protein MJB10_06625 [Paenibacillus sp. MBLB1832]
MEKKSYPLNIVAGRTFLFGLYGIMITPARIQTFRNAVAVQMASGSHHGLVSPVYALVAAAILDCVRVERFDRSSFPNSLRKLTREDWRAHNGGKL